MASTSRKDLPNSSAPNWAQRVTEELRVLMGRAGKGRALTADDLISSGIAKPGVGGGMVPNAPSELVEYEPDLTPPPTPTGFGAEAALTNVLFQHDAAHYRQGHGHAMTVVYGVMQAEGEPPATFDRAVELTRFSGTVASYPTTPATSWRFWIKWLSNDGVLSVDPAGGIHGVMAVTGQNVQKLLDVLQGQITESQLYQDLANEIALISGTAAGSVNARLLTEAQERARVVALEAQARAQDVAQIAANLRSASDALQGNIDAVNAQVADIIGAGDYSSSKAYDAGQLVKSQGKLYRSKVAVPANNPPPAAAYWDLVGDYDSIGEAVAAHAAQLTDHATRIGQTEQGLTAEVSARSTLAAQLRGSYTGTDVAQVSAGLVWSERQSRVAGDSANASLIQGVRSDLTSTQGTVAGQGTAISGLQSSVTSINGSLTSQANSITQLQASVGSASEGLKAMNALGSESEWMIVGTNTGSVMTKAVPDASGGAVLVVGGNTGGNDMQWLRHSATMPLDPSRLYKITARFRRTAGTGGIYFGIAALNATKTRYVTANDVEGTGLGSAHYAVIHATPALNVWQTVEGYYRGRSAGAVTGSGTLAAPWAFANKVAHLSLLFLGNYNGASGSCELDFLTFEDVTESAKAAADVVSEAVTRAAEDGALASRATALEARMPAGAGQLATAAALSSLSSEVSQQGDKINSQSGSIVALTNSLNGIGGSGANLLPAEYCSFGATLPALAFSAANFDVSTVAEAGAHRGYVLRMVTKNTSIAANLYFSPGTNYAGSNLVIKPGRYLLSFNARASVAGHLVRMMLRTIGPTGAAEVFNLDTHTVSTSMVRYSTVANVTSPIALDHAEWCIYPNRSGVAGVAVDVDQLMIEPMIGVSEQPSVFVPGPSGDLANTKADASALALLQNTVTQQGNSITSQGSSITSLSNSISGLQGAGDNLLKASNVELVRASQSYPMGWYETSETLVVGETYTLVACITHTPASGDTTSSVGAWVNGSQTIATNMVRNGSMVVATATFVRVAAGAGTNIAFYYYPSSVKTGTATVHWACLYKGKVVPPLVWQPSVAELEASVAANSSATSALTTRVTSAEGQLTAQTTQLSQIQATVAGNTSAIQQNASAQADVNGYVAAQYSMKVQVASNGKTAVGGMAVQGTSTGTAGPTIDFGIMANTFWVGAPAGSGLTSANLFVVRTAATTINGQPVPAGVYFGDAFIGNGTITSAKIGKLQVDDGHMVSLSVAKLLAGSLAVGRYIQSTNYVAGLSGWRINADGKAELSEVTVRGAIYATSGSIGGLTLRDNAITAGAYTGFGWPTNGGTGFVIGPGGILMGNYNTGKWFEVQADGSVISMPGLRIVNGVATFTGTLNVKSAASGARLEITSTLVSVYDGNGTLRVRLGIW